MARFTERPLASNSAHASSREREGSNCRTVRMARSINLSLVAETSTMRLPRTLPRRVKSAVVMQFKASFVAVPALSRVLPVSTSGPVSRTMK